MATDLELLMVRVEANLTKYEREMKRASQIADKETRRISDAFTKANPKIAASAAKLGVTFGNSMKGIGAGIIGGLGLQQIVSAAASAAASIADIGDAAARLGISTGEFQALTLVARDFDVEVDQLAKGMKTLAVNSSEAARGNGEFAKWLAANNVSITDANGRLKSQGDILAIVSEMVRQAASEQDGLAIAQAAMGNAGARIYPALAQGAGALAASLAEARSRGVEFSEEQIAKADEIDKAFKRITDTLSFELKSAFLELATSAERDLNSIGEAAERNRGKIGMLLEAYKAADEWAREYGPFSDRAQQAYGYGTGQVVNRSGRSDLPSNVTGTGYVGNGKSGQALLDSLDKFLGTGGPTKPPADNNSGGAGRKLGRTRTFGTGSDLVEKATRERDAVNALIAELKFEGEQLRRNDLQQEVHNQLRRAGASATAEQRNAIIDTTTANYEYAKSQEALQAAEKTATELRSQSLEGQREAFMELGRMGVGALEAIALNGEKAGDVMIDLAKQLASAALQGSLLGEGPFGKFFGGSKGGGLIGSIFSALSGSFGGGRASGGSMAPDKWHVVGERGPEIIPPLGRAATVIPNHVIQATAGIRALPSEAQRGGSTSTSPVFHIHVTGATGNNEVMRMVQSGVAAGIAQSQRTEAIRESERRLRG